MNPPGCVVKPSVKHLYLRCVYLISMKTKRMMELPPPTPTYGWSRKCFLHTEAPSIVKQGGPAKHFVLQSWDGQAFGLCLKRTKVVGDKIHMQKII